MREERVVERARRESVWLRETEVERGEGVCG